VRTDFFQDLHPVFDFQIKLFREFEHPYYMKILILFFLVISNVAVAAPPTFSCYSTTPQPAQIYEYSNMCPSGSDINLGNKKSDRHVVICVYNAMCAPTGPNAQVGIPRLSTLMCTGSAVFDKGVIQPDAQTCPKLNECQKDIFFNFAMGLPVGATDGQFVVPQPTELTK